MEESTALWLLGMAHSEYEAARSELDSTYGWRKAMAQDLDAARKEVDALRVERMTLRDERDAARAEAEALRKATHAFATHEQAEIVVAPHAVAPGEVMAEAEPSTLKGMYAELKAERSVSAGLRAELAESRQVADLRWRDLCGCQKELDAAVAELAAERVELAKLHEDLDVMRDAERDACDEVANLNDQLAELREAVKEWIKARDAYMGDTLEEEGDLFGTMIQSFYKVREMVGLRGAPASNEPTTDPIDLNTEG